MYVYGKYTVNSVSPYSVQNIKKYTCFFIVIKFPEKLTYRHESVTFVHTKNIRCDLILQLQNECTAKNMARIFFYTFLLTKT
jgi:hypothetical protein